MGVDASDIPYVQIRFAAGTIDELLDEVAKQAPGIVWVVSERVTAEATSSCSFDYFSQSVRISTGWQVPVR
jgi:hypothetical protein